MRIKPEEQLQIDIVNHYYRNVKDKLPYQSLLFSIRNENAKGGWRGIIAGGIYKQMGRIAGIPDLIFLYNKSQPKIVFIEIKTEKAYFTSTGKITKSMGLSEEQIKTHELLRKMDFDVVVIYNIEAFDKFILSL